MKMIAMTDVEIRIHDSIITFLVSSIFLLCYINDIIQFQLNNPQFTNKNIIARISFGYKLTQHHKLGHKNWKRNGNIGVDEKKQEMLLDVP